MANEFRSNPLSTGAVQFKASEQHLVSVKGRENGQPECGWFAATMDDRHGALAYSRDSRREGRRVCGAQCEPPRFGAAFAFQRLYLFTGQLNLAYGCRDKPWALNPIHHGSPIAGITESMTTE